jgi:hypothetical protein
MNRVKRFYRRQQTAAQLLESREKSIVELGILTHRKIAGGQIADTELAAVSQTIDGWDRLLGQLLAEGKGKPASIQPNGQEMQPDVTMHLGEQGGDTLSSTVGNETLGRWRIRINPFVWHSLFGALLSVILTLTLCLALSTIANMAINQAVTFGKAAVANKVQDKVQEKLDVIKPDKLNGKLGTMATEKVRALVESKWSAFTRFQSEADYTLLDVPTTYLLVHNVKSQAHLGLVSNLASSEMQLQIGLYVWLLLPLLAFLIGGYVSAWRSRIVSLKQALSLSLIVGAANALLMVLLTQTSGFSSALELPRGIGNVDIVYRFSAASALLNGFVLGTLFSLTGALLKLGGFKWAKIFRSERISYSEPIRIAVAAIAGGVLLSFVYMLILLWFKGLLSATLVLLLPQLAVYAWGIASGNIFHMTNFLASQGKQMEISVFAGIQGTGMEGYAAEWNLYVILSALLPLVLLLFIGMRLKPRFGGLPKQTMIFSAAYAVLMALMMLLTRVGMTVRGQAAFIDVKSFTLEAGFSALATLVTCFIVAYVCVTAGAKLNARYRFRRQSSMTEQG